MIYVENLKNKKIVLCGKGKLKADFLYVFDSLNISDYLDEDFDEKRIDSIKQETDLSATPLFIIICSRKSNDVKKKLKDLGMRDGIDFCSGEDLFINLEKGIRLAAGRDIYVWGTGLFARKLVSTAAEYGISLSFIKGFIDSNPKSDSFEGFKVLTPDDFFEGQKGYIWVAVDGAYPEIKKHLIEKGFKEQGDFIQMLNFGKVYQMMMQTYMAYPDKNNRFVCDRATELVGIDVNGNVVICCENMMNNPYLGNLFENTFQEIWESPISKIHHLSIKNGTYAFCKYRYCIRLNGEKEDDLERDEHLVEFLPDVIGEKRIFLEGKFDYTCNLRCSSCRNSIKAMEYDEKREFLINRIAGEILPYSNTVLLAGNGEIFVSRQYKELLKKVEYVPDLSILSNGTKMDFDVLDQLVNKCDRLIVSVSVDAATEETYGKIRRGGDFNSLLHNLKEIKERRDSGLIQHFNMYFVVQRDNVQEMREFYELAKSLHADEVIYTTLQNWGTYTEEEFDKISLWDSNLKLKKENKKYFRDSFFEDPMVTTDWNKDDII